jgi:hypothetical protein
LTGTNNAFATESFKGNPLVAIQHDGDLSKIEDNTKLNSIISHEEIVINEKFKPLYNQRVNSFLFMGTNKPVRITDAKSGIIRRLIDVHPTGNTIAERRYHVLMNQTNFELGAIAAHCLEVYRLMGSDYYSSYRPIEMMLTTDVFFNYVQSYFDVFKMQDGTSLKQAYEMYKTYCSETQVEFQLPQYKFREELKNYFGNFTDRALVEGERMRSWYSGFLTSRFTSEGPCEQEVYSLSMEDEVSIFDGLMAEQPAQLSKWSDKTQSEVPLDYWSNCKTTLSEIDTKQTHYVKVPENHVIIDFDLKDENGEKSAEKNIAAASAWPPTYAEFSQGGNGVHLHYDYTGDVNELSRVYSEGIEVKVFTGNSSLRRRLSRCNTTPVATINSGLPLREKKVLNFDGFKNELQLRSIIMKNLRKEIHPGTKPSIDFIAKCLEDAYNTPGLQYDVTDMRQRILAFAGQSTHSPEYCVKLVLGMKFVSEVAPGTPVTPTGHPEYFDARLVFFDTEVFPNLFLISWKYEGPNSQVVHMVNPKPKDIEPLLKLRLVGFNNRRYDNHMVYAAYMGYNNEQLYQLSKKMINGNHTAMFGEAYNLSYTDIYDFSSKKASLKRFQIDLGIHHQELGFDWDQPVPEEKWPLVISYCGNDVVSTEAVFNDRIEDFQARQILAALSGLTLNSTTQQHTAKIIFGDDRKPQEQFVYTDLSEEFPGYVYDFGKSTYKGFVTGEGGFVHAKPGMYTDVALLDIASMHPTTIEVLNMFGIYTQNFSDLKAARIAIKRGNFEEAKGMLGGVLAPYLKDKESAKALAYALKIVINIVYGLTSAKFDNLFRDPRNKDNICAKRGALFMVDLLQAVEEQGFTVVHIKTDSIKIANATPEIIEFVMQMGKQYGYEFEHECTYEKFCLVNDAVYIAKEKGDPWAADQSGHWTATGAQFQHPFVFKTLFSKEPLEFRDLCETKTVTTALYLDFDSVDPMWKQDKEPEPKFVGKAGSFCPIKEGCGGGLLVREKEGKFYAATGTKGYFWLQAEEVMEYNKQDDIDMEFFKGLVDDAVANISKWGDFEWFVSDEKEAVAA